jgi:predicted DCC family thiol-disulfide oxidoreductase YuxK
VLYDGECPLCTGSARRFEGVLRRRGFELATLQSRENSPIPPSEMRVLTPDGRAHGGAAALVQIARRVWWAWPLFAVAQIPGVMRLFNLGYRWLARNRKKLSALVPAKGGEAPQNGTAKKPEPKRRTRTFFEMP